jgi:predicted XRE-type DNA-binding protein
MREGADVERAELKALIDGLRSQLKQTQLSQAEEIELLKVKMAQLHQADVESLESFYENEVAMLHLEVNTQREAHLADREKLYTLLQEND